MRIFFLLIVFFFSLTNFAQQTLPYKNKELPIEERVSDLIKRMTLEEKVAQIRHIHSSNIYDDQKLNEDRLHLFCKGLSWGFVEGFYLTAENCSANFYTIQKYMVEKTRLGIPVFTIGESIHGLVQENSTIYPHNIALGSTFNPELAYEKTKAIAGELQTAGIKQVLAPCVDVARDLRWGRIEECYGEDPYLCGIMGIAEVNGYMDNGISPMLKHFGAHGTPVGGLNLAAVECGLRDLHDIYLRPFEMIIRNTNVLAVMSSYNSWNRIPNSASKYLMTDVLRKRWGFKGYVYSDWGAIDMLQTFHKIVYDQKDAAMFALTSGLDVEASSNAYKYLFSLIKENALDIEYLDIAVQRVLYAKFKAGLFDDPYGLIFKNKRSSRDDQSKALSKRIADESTVLIKNENNLLPLDINKIKSLAIIGPNANQVQFGDYTWSKSNEDGVTPLAGIKALVGEKVKINYTMGCSLVSKDTSGISEAVKIAQESDVAILFVGSSSEAFVRYTQTPATTGEGYDLNCIELTGVQHELIERVYATGKPVIVVLVAGKPFAIPWIKENIPVVLAQWYAGEQQGNSIADILFGKINPSGKLTFTFPAGTGNLPCYYNYLPSDRGFYKKHGSYENPGRDYVFSSPNPLWAFGHGLSYTTFQINNAITNKTQYNESDTIFVDVEVKNTGQRHGKEVVQVYIRDVVSSVITPVKQLKAFQKAAINAGEIKLCRLSIPISELYLTDEKGFAFCEAGEFDVMIGNSSDRISHTLRISVGNVQMPEVQKEKTIKTIKDQFNIGKDITVKGFVRDIQGVPIAGVQVQAESNLMQKVQTGKKGEFVIKINENDRILFSKKGHIPVSEEVGSRNIINIQLSYAEY